MSSSDHTIFILKISRNFSPLTGVGAVTRTAGPIRRLPGQGPGQQGQSEGSQGSDQKAGPIRRLPGPSQPFGPHRKLLRFLVPANQFREPKPSSQILFSKKWDLSQPRWDKCHQEGPHQLQSKLSEASWATKATTLPSATVDSSETWRACQLLVQSLRKKKVRTKCKLEGLRDSFAVKTPASQV